MNDRQTRTITEEKEYLPYCFSANVKTTYSFPYEDARLTILTFQGLSTNYYRLDGKTFVGRFALPKVNFHYCTIGRDIEEMLPTIGWGSPFDTEIKNVAMSIDKSASFTAFASKEEAEDTLRQLTDRGLIFSGYLYESKYHQHLLFYEKNTVHISFDYWSGKWVKARNTNKKEKITHDP